jgi:hypothetical protein
LVPVQSRQAVLVLPHIPLHGVGIGTGAANAIPAAPPTGLGCPPGAVLASAFWIVYAGFPPEAGAGAQKLNVPAFAAPGGPTGICIRSTPWLASSTSVFSSNDVIVPVPLPWPVHWNPVKAGIATADAGHFGDPVTSL